MFNMNQLTSDAALVVSVYYVRSPWVNIVSLPGITTGFLMIFRYAHRLIS